MNKYLLYYDILDEVVYSGRLELNTPEELELEIEIEHEARKRGLNEDEIKEAVTFVVRYLPWVVLED
jgi:hypothetical protein